MDTTDQLKGLPGMPEGFHESVEAEYLACNKGDDLPNWLNLVPAELKKTVIDLAMATMDPDAGDSKSMNEHLNWFTRRWYYRHRMFPHMLENLGMAPVESIEPGSLHAVEFALLTESSSFLIAGPADPAGFREVTYGSDPIRRKGIPTTFSGRFATPPVLGKVAKVYYENSVVAVNGDRYNRLETGLVISMAQKQKLESRGTAMLVEAVETGFLRIDHLLPPPSASRG